MRKGRKYMSKNLVIVESPSKTKPIEKYLGEGYKVLSSKGHVRDLSTKGKFGFGVDIDNDFKPDYVTMKGKKSVIDELKKLEGNSEDILLLQRFGLICRIHLHDKVIAFFLFFQDLQCLRRIGRGNNAVGNLSCQVSCCCCITLIRESSKITIRRHAVRASCTDIGSRHGSQFYALHEIDLLFNI